MLNYRKIRDKKAAMQRIVEKGDLLAALFEGIPELKGFTFLKNQEYDDNNYFDNIQVTSINGHRFGWDGYEDEVEYETDEDGDEVVKLESELPRIEETGLIKDVVTWIADDYDFSENEVEIEREDWEDWESPRKDDPERVYWSAQVAGTRLPDEFFVEADNSNYALYHALEHGRFSPETEFAIFAKRGEMHAALEYAQHIIKGRLPKEIENFYILDADECDKDCLKLYLDEFVRDAA